MVNQLLSEIISLDEKVDNSELFQEVCSKSIELSRKQQEFKRFDAFKAYLVGHLTVGDLQHPKISSTIKIDSLNILDIYDALSKEIIPSIVILTNNSFATIGSSRFEELRKLTPKCLYVIHDYDCHHWYNNSFQCMLNSDVYIPAHFQIAPFTKFLLTHRLLVIPAGSIQWAKNFLIRNAKNISETPRRLSITGKHAFYPKFHYRNKLVATFGKHFPSIGFINVNEYHDLTSQQKLNDWMSSDLHFIAPASFDVPIRVFDALVSGGIPVVPQWLTSSLQGFGVPDKWYETYGPLDLLSPVTALKKWVEKVSKHEGSERRTRAAKALSMYHLDNILYQLTDHALSVVSFPE